MKTNNGNRSTGTLGDYMLSISRGQTLDEIGKRYGVTPGAVRKALKAHGLPTCAIDFLRWLHKKDASALEFGKDLTCSND
jgi:hypothetical protein